MTCFELTTALPLSTVMNLCIVSSQRFTHAWVGATSMIAVDNTSQSKVSSKGGELSHQPSQITNAILLCIELPLLIGLA